MPINQCDLLVCHQCGHLFRLWKCTKLVCIPPISSWFQFSDIFYTCFVLGMDTVVEWRGETNFGDPICRLLGYLQVRTLSAVVMYRWVLQQRSLTARRVQQLCDAWTEWTQWGVVFFSKNFGTKVVVAQSSDISWSTLEPGKVWRKAPKLPVWCCCNVELRILRTLCTW